MESAPNAIRIKAKVTSVVERFHRIYTGGIGAEASFEEASLGWFIIMEGSWEALYVGTTKPRVKVGDTATIRITFHAHT